MHSPPSYWPGVRSGCSGSPRFFTSFTWTPYAALARRIASGRHREDYLSIYGPLSLLTLFACWAIGLIVGFGLLQWAVGLQIRDGQTTIGGAIYFSATVLGTLGLAEPLNVVSKWIMVVEAGFWLSFLALVLSYLPVFYQSFSSRELRISLLDARAGSPPTAAELVLRQGPNPEKLEQQLANWEEWAA
ncbi:MAG: channel, pore region [Bryobacterales bacterium]|nr:channel, pore region [Bryobacterales bacterium]